MLGQSQQTVFFKTFQQHPDTKGIHELVSQLNAAKNYIQPMLQLK